MHLYRNVVESVSVEREINLTISYRSGAAGFLCLLVLTARSTFEILVESTFERLNNKGRHRIEAYICKQFLVVKGKDWGGEITDAAMERLKQMKWCVNELSYT